MSGRRCSTCGCTVRKTVRGDMVTTRLGRVPFRGPLIHSCDHGQDEHRDHSVSPRVVPLSKRTWVAEARRASEQYNEEWDRAWDVYVSGVDER